MENVNVAMIGGGFMGRAHSNAYGQVVRFFDPPVMPIMHTVCGRTEKPELGAFAKRWGWQNSYIDWETLVTQPEIGLVDIVTPNDMHRGPALAAIKAGIPVACEKPLADTLDGAREMAKAANEASVPTFVWFNYRRCPAVALAYQMVRDGMLGDIRRIQATYLQDWADESIPLVWRFCDQRAGSGAHGDLNAHVIDMARFVSGLEITEVAGAIAQTFIKKRRLVDTSSVGIGSQTDGGDQAGADQEGTAAEMGDVTVDDTVLFLARWSNGAVGSFEAARQATGNQNRNTFEINGTKGALSFDFERMNELEFYDATRPRAQQGWTTIMCTHEGAHPYMKQWWPDAHTIGYEHGFTHQVYDMMTVLAGQEPTVPLPDFEDAYQTQRVLEAALIAAHEGRLVKLNDVR